MEEPQKTLAMLFAQLGLPDDPNSIAIFIAEHRPLAADIVLNEAPFWTNSQCRFLREELALDADWCETIDVLSVLLR